jgi:hypothetical protein
MASGLLLDVGWGWRSLSPLDADGKSRRHPHRLKTEKTMRLTILSMLLTLVAVPAIAGSDEPGRYQILSVSGGFVRLDTATGATTFCRDEVDSFRCAPVPIAVDKAPAEAGATGDRTRDSRSPDDAAANDDLDKALTFMEKAMRGLMAMTEEKTPECAL